MGHEDPWWTFAQRIMMVRFLLHINIFTLIIKTKT